MDALNVAAPGVWDYVRSPAAHPTAVEDEDVIRTAFIYKKAAAEPVGDSVILDRHGVRRLPGSRWRRSFKPVGAEDSPRVLADRQPLQVQGFGDRQ